MEEVAFCETEFFGIVWIGGIVVESFNDLFRERKLGAGYEAEV